MKEASLQALIDKLQKDFGLNSSETIKRIYKLWKKNELDILDIKPPLTFFDYLLSSRALRFWVLNIIILTSLFVTLFSIGPLLYVRYILGSIYVLYLPGSILIEALYPRGEDLDSLTKVTLSIVSSLSLVSMIAFLLNYTPFKIRLIPLTVSLTLLTEGITIFMVIRKYQIYTSNVID